MSKSETSETLIRLYRRDGGALEVVTSETYEIEELGGEIPNVGDIIISPWMNNPKDDYNKPERRTFYEVVRRYFTPGRDPGGGPRISLEVQARPGQMDELELPF